MNGIVEAPSLSSLLDECPLLDEPTPAASPRTIDGTTIALGLAGVAGRPVLVGTATGAGGIVSTTALLAVVEHAEALGLPSITVTPGRPCGMPAFAAAAGGGVHVLVSPLPDPVADVALAAHSVLRIGLDDDASSAPVLTADDPASALELACVLLSYLPSGRGRPAPSYLPAERSELTGIGPAESRNALAILFTICDDVLRVLPADTDELLLAMARIDGRSIAVAAPQPLAGRALTLPSLVRLNELVALCADLALPLLVLGSAQELRARSQPVGELLRALAVAAGRMTRPLLRVVDHDAGSVVDQVLGAVPTAVVVDPVAGLRRELVRWLDIATVSG